jgi:16S rRNA (cytidine1402-2'-O)-methyltransferase
MQERLYVVCTPIGNLKDFSTRGAETLRFVDFVLCEDTRVTRKLLDHYAINTKLMVYNDHNALIMIPRILHLIENEQKTFAIVSDAGTPLIFDPGYKLIQAIIKKNIKYTIIPGPSAVMAAVVLSGFDTAKFMFCGFFDIKKVANLQNVEGSLVFFESPKRLVSSLIDLHNIFPNRNIAVIREITKIHEEVIRGTFVEVLAHFDDQAPRGEITIVLSSPVFLTCPAEVDLEETTKLIRLLVSRLPIKEVCSIVLATKKISKKKVYDIAKNIHDL